MIRTENGLLIMNEHFSKSAIYGFDEDESLREFNENFTLVGNFLNNEDFYQGLNMVTVVVDNHTGQAYGYFWWDDISKHGESLVEANGDEFGYPYDDENDVEFFVWQPVESFTITGYRRAERDFMVESFEARTDDMRQAFSDVG